jgi:hypothetical protein
MAYLHVKEKGYLTIIEPAELVIALVNSEHTNFIEFTLKELTGNPPKNYNDKIVINKNYIISIQ